MKHGAADWCMETERRNVAYICLQAYNRLVVSLNRQCLRTATFLPIMWKTLFMFKSVDESEAVFVLKQQCGCFVCML